jgi:hypothetical protein
MRGSHRREAKLLIQPELGSVVPENRRALEPGEEFHAPAAAAIHPRRLGASQTIFFSAARRFNSGDGLDWLTRTPHFFRNRKMIRESMLAAAFGKCQAAQTRSNFCNAGPACGSQALAQHGLGRPARQRFAGLL